MPTASRTASTSSNRPSIVVPPPPAHVGQPSHILPPPRFRRPPPAGAHPHPQAPRVRGVHPPVLGEPLDERREVRVLPQPPEAAQEGQEDEVGRPVADDLVG